MTVFDNVFLVGGAVRDTLLGLQPKDLDYVVVDATEADMFTEGFERVGADFPVFLHPSTKDEYALARTERKSGKGYNGFECNTDGVTLEDDLRRRDLTINAMAMDEFGEVVDPFGGQEDLKNGILRHVSESFSEDPVRVLRAARFAARYKFQIAPETMALMRDLVEQGELDHLTAERVWAETAKALSEGEPGIFFGILQAAGALQLIMPWIRKIEMKIDGEPEVVFASLVAAQNMSRADLDELAMRLRLPNEFKDMAKVAQLAAGVSVKDATAMTKLMVAADAFRKPVNFSRAVTAVMSSTNATRAAKALNAALGVSVRSLGLDPSTMSGKAVGAAVLAGRHEAIKDAIA